MDNSLIISLLIIVPIYSAALWHYAFKAGKESQEPRISALRKRQSRLVIEREDAVVAHRDAERRYKSLLSYYQPAEKDESD
jgi:hypothetical protein